MNKSIPTYFLIFILIFGAVSPSLSNAYAEESGIFPPWVRTVFTFWANGDVTDQDLKGALEYLLANKVLDLEKKPTKSATAASPQGVKTSSILHDSQKSNITINDSNFFSVAQNAVAGWVKEIKNNRTANLVVKSSLPIIPVIGPLLANLYDNAEGTAEQKNTMVLEVLEKYQKMDQDQLALAFAKLDGNKVAIEKNTYKLVELQADTKEILIVVKETNQIVKDTQKQIAESEKRILEQIKIGKNTQVSSENIKDANQIIQSYSTASNLEDTQLESLAKSYLIGGQSKSAIIVYDRILNQDPNNYGALIEKAWALFDVVDYDEEDMDDDLQEVKNAFKAVLKYYPQDSEAYEGLGWTYLDLGNPSLARDNFNESLRWDNQNEYAAAGIGWSHLEDGNCEEAKKTFDNVLKYFPNNEDALEGKNAMYSDYGC